MVNRKAVKSQIVRELDIEKPISARRLDYLMEKLDDYLWSCMRPNEMLELDLTLRDFHTQESTKKRYMVVSRFGDSAKIGESSK